MRMVPIGGLYEAHLSVRDLGRSIAFYRDVLGLPLAHTVPARGAAFFWVPAPGTGMLGLWSSGTAPMQVRLHIAFRVALSDVEASIPALEAAGLMPEDGDGVPIDEPVVIAWMPAASVYFKDPDGHSLEFIAILGDAPRPDLGRLPLSKWRAL